MQLCIGNIRFAPTLIPSLMFLALFPFLLSLGFWQLDRAEQKQQLVADEQSGGGKAVVDLNLVDELQPRQRFSPATVIGEFHPQQQWLLDNRMKDGLPGYHVFSLLIVRGSKDLLVNRGWVGIGASREFLPRLALPEGEVRLNGRLDTPASVGLAMDVDYSQVSDRLLVQNLNISALAVANNLNLQPMALVLDQGQSGSLIHDWIPVAQMGPEKHLGYAVQWFALSLALLVIYLGTNTKRCNEVKGKEVE